MSDDTPVPAEQTWNSTEYNTLIVLAMRLPDDIMTYEKHIIALNRYIDGLNKRKKEIETSVAAEVASERVTLEGKTRSLYLNEAIREAETNSRLRNNQEYLQLNQDVVDKISSMRDKEAELSRLKNQFRGLEVVTDVLKIKWRVGI